MKKSQFIFAAVVVAALVAGAAYGTKIPLIGTLAKKLPGTNAV